MVKSTMTETCSAVLRSRRNYSSDGAERTDDEEQQSLVMLEMASPENRHCASCIGAKSFPIGILVIGSDSTLCQITFTTAVFMTHVTCRLTA